MQQANSCSDCESKYCIKNSDFMNPFNLNLIVIPPLDDT